MPGIDTGDTAWVLVCAALVMFMTPGLAFFYGGLVRAKNVLGTIMQSFIALALVTVLWVLVGYSLAFGPDKAGLIGGLDFVGLHHVGAAPSAYAPTVPATAFMVFQMMFAIITPALIAGAFAERMKFSGYLMLIGLWSIFVYAPVAHWEWGGGFLGASGVGALDFAGGAVVHANAGAAALATAIYIGKRRGYGSDDMSPHNVPFVILGAGILWFGWFGFNAGSALGANALASSAFVNTQLGAAAAVLGWIALERTAHGQGHDDRRGDGRGGRPRHDHPGRGLRAAAGGPRDRPRRRARVLPGGEPEGSVRLRRLAGRRRRAHGRRRHRRAPHRRVRQPGHQRGRRGREPRRRWGSRRSWPASRSPSRSLATLAILKVTDLTVGLRVTEEHEDAGLDAIAARRGRVPRLSGCLDGLIADRPRRVPDAAGMRLSQPGLPGSDRRPGRRSHARPARSSRAPRQPPHVRRGRGGLPRRPASSAPPECCR